MAPYNQLLSRKFLAILPGVIFSLIMGCAIPEPRPVAVNDLDMMKPKEVINEAKNIPPLGPPAFTEKTEPAAKGLTQDARLYSLAFESASLGSILSAITVDTDLNLSVEADIDLMRPVTVNLKQVTFEEALDMVVVKGAGYSWHIEEDNLYIKKFEERIYTLDYPDLVGETQVDIGGDMLASGVENAGVAGKYQFTGTKEKKNTDVWTGIQEALETLKSADGLLRIDRNTGIIYMSDFPRNIASMVRLLDLLSESLHRQVFIEARIMEVQLNDDNKLGIDWSSLKTTFKSSSQAWPDVFEFTVNGDGAIILGEPTGVEGMVDFLRTQGDVSVLSNPHLSLMNGQSAVMTVGSQFPYGDIDGVDRDSETGLITYGASIKRAVLGLQLGISAQISANGIVALHIVPTVTRIQREKDVQIPTTATTSSTISNPIIDLQELSTMVRVKNGQSVVLGGLITQMKTLDHEGLPWLGRIPLIGNLFKHSDDKTESKELVIVITPYIKKVG